MTILTKREAWKDENGYWCVVEIQWNLTTDEKYSRIVRQRMPHGEAEGHVNKWNKGH
jgi:hypothetical protein